MNARIVTRVAAFCAGAALTFIAPALATAAPTGGDIPPPVDAGTPAPVQSVLPALGSGSAAAGTGSSTGAGVLGALGTGSSAAGSLAGLVPGPGSVLSLLGTGSGAASGSAQAGGTLAQALGSGSAAAGAGSSGVK
ncbi:hypothetical protein ACFVUS_41860 [Nocardia sp. NPDC058058]|uniref:hypothetical protein n=1 Tax=Nocardia sp. NPDC058058 TaxID=3346317 RepID=UPI0036DD618A